MRHSRVDSRLSVQTGDPKVPLHVRLLRLPSAEPRVQEQSQVHNSKTCFHHSLPVGAIVATTWTCQVFHKRCLAPVSRLVQSRVGVSGWVAANPLRDLVVRRKAVLECHTDNVDSSTPALEQFRAVVQ